MPHRHTLPSDTTRHPRDNRKTMPGPRSVLFSQGFRPFFLAAGVWAAVSMAAWLGMLSGIPLLPLAIAPLAWHAHELIYGFVMAAMAGFLLTAIPNWTGRLPVRGTPLAALAGLWLLGRAAMAASAQIGPAAAAAADLAFPLALLMIVLREIAAGRNWRNLPVAGAVAVLCLADLLMHLEFLDLAPIGGAGRRLALVTVATLIALIGGRIVPSFTRNWLAKRGAARLPAPFGRFDRAVLGFTVGAAVIWTIAPDTTPAGIAMLAAGLGHGLRLARWRTLATLTEPLLWVLHLAYGWLALGFGLLGAAQMWSALPASAAVHALTAGAMGTMTLAVMTRASLGHSGRPLSAGRGTTVVYLLATVGAVLRLIAPALTGAETLVLVAAGVLWAGAFALFALLYGPILIRPPRRA